MESKKHARNKVIGVTGTPGTGKKTVSEKLAEILGYKHVNLNELAFRCGAVVGEDEYGFIASPRKLRSSVRGILADRRVILAGHLLPSVASRSMLDLVAVLRCLPTELEERLRERGYPEEKVRENVAAEVLGVCLTDALERFGSKKVFQFDTTGKEPKVVAAEIANTLHSKRQTAHVDIDWLPWAAERRLIGRYFQAG